MRHRSILFAACVFAAATLSPAHARAQTPVRFSGAAALALPVGDLGDAAEPGFNLALRGEGRLPGRNWSLRGDLTWDRFTGKGAIDSYSYYGLAANLVHRYRTERVYEFGGLGLYGNTTTFASQFNRNDANLGVQMGLGLDLDRGPHTPFVEFGLTSVFTSGNNSLWFPVNFGIRF